ncbi:hypothetical protein OH76DRAFT_1489916 [Lentinus brumalis]|uniref:Uncharacterized protein n=1 Tax=Lentinus brumalis TaxID=2498619 RepID=A0A371CKS5_9APHY|nr:hypothetical protein OH76DRAFT_1489916 [Polyporus brumalis]
MEPLQDGGDLINYIEFRSDEAHEQDPMSGDGVIGTQHSGTVESIFKELAIGMRRSDIDSMFEELAQEAIKMYLRGRGHPEHVVFRDIIGEATFEHERQDTLLRSQMFLRWMTGKDVIQHDSNARLQIFFSHRGDRGCSVHAGAPFPASPIRVTAPTARCTFIIDEGLRNLLRQAPPFCSFQTWLHGVVLDPNVYDVL